LTARRVLIYLALLSKADEEGFRQFLTASFAVFFQCRSINQEWL
jgi:hypothetical protein